MSDIELRKMSREEIEEKFVTTMVGLAAAKECLKETDDFLSEIIRNYPEANYYQKWINDVKSRISAILEK